MSTILHRRDCHVAISALDAGLEFAQASADVQAQFLEGIYTLVDCKRHEDDWRDQCRKVSEEIKRERAVEIATALETLAYAIRDRKDGFVSEGWPWRYDE